MDGAMAGPKSTQTKFVKIISIIHIHPYMLAFLDHHACTFIYTLGIKLELDLLFN